MPLTFYGFYFKKGAYTVACEVAECESDSAALEKASELLSESDYESIEVWQGAARMIGAVERG